MKFTRINDNTVNCIITADDMDEQGLSLEDLFHKREESMAFLQEIIARAAEEVDYHPDGSFLPMQMTVLPDGSVSLTLSENANASLAELLQGLADRLRQFLSELTESQEKAQAKTEPVPDAEESDSAKKGEKAEQMSPEKRRLRDLLRQMKRRECVFSFDSIRSVSRFAETVGQALRVRSSLYKNAADGRYYLCLERFGAAEDTGIPEGKPFHVIDGVPVTSDMTQEDTAFAMFYIHATEYGSFVSSEQRFVLHVRESMTCVIAEDALERLARL